MIVLMTDPLVASGYRSVGHGGITLSPRQATIIAAKFHLLAGTAFLAIMIVSELQIVDFMFTRLGWWLAPWREFPLPYDWEYFGWQGQSADYVFLFIILGPVQLLICASVILLMHGFVFRLTVRLHRWFGWPNYCSELGDAFNLRTAWAESARRSWWIWPVALLILTVWGGMAMGLRRARYPIIDDGFLSLAANLLAVVLGFAYIASLVVREHVIALIGPNERRCVNCDYCLRGLQSRVCPECAHPFDLGKPAEFRFRWERFEVASTWRRVVRILLPAALLSAPLWVPLAVLCVPNSWRQVAPRALQPRWELIARNPNAFPLRHDAVCVIRHGEGVCVVRFSKQTLLSARYEAGYWSKSVNFGESPPELTTSGRVGFGIDRDLPLGPWIFTYGSLDEHLLWIYRPDETFEVSVLRADDFDGDLSWTEEIGTSAP